MSSPSLRERLDKIGARKLLTNRFATRECNSMSASAIEEVSRSRGHFRHHLLFDPPRSNLNSKATTLAGCPAPVARQSDLFHERWIANGQDACLLREYRWPLDHRHGNWRLRLLRDVPQAALKLLARAAANDSIRVEDCLFLDTETTGLAGGTGTVAFLVGCAYLKENCFVLKQFFFPDFSGEAVLVGELEALLPRFSCLVTFNGKSYDFPLLQTRFAMHRRLLDPSRWFHADLLHIARTLWRRRLNDCSLATLERAILQVDRDTDIPSHRIPQMYFDFLRHRRIDSMRSIFSHNAWDLLTSAGLLATIASVLQAPSSSVDHASLARWFCSRGEISQALACCRLGGTGEALELEGIIRTKLKDPGARRIWERLIEGPGYRGVRAFWELSLLEEREGRDLCRAVRILEQGIARCRESSTNGAQRLSRRKHRLEKKLGHESQPPNSGHELRELRE